jgi:two-component system cell cycle response regulator
MIEPAGVTLGSQYDPSRRAQDGSCRVLVVDDDVIVRAHLSALLNTCHYQVETATTGEEALRVLDRTACQIVLTDWHMPDMDGLALCRHLRLRDPECYVYVVLLTIRGAQSDRLAGFAAGADDYLMKGAAIDEILARLEIGRRITSRAPTSRAGDQTPRSSDRDSVTGAHNLAYLAQHLSRELARSRRYGRSLGVLECEIRANPNVHGQFGCVAVEKWLREFVAGSGACIRESDWLARTGEFEFMFVLPETGTKGAHCVAEKLRRLTMLHSLDTPAGPVGFTADIGVNTLEAHRDADCALRIKALLRKAEQRRHAEQRICSARAEALGSV